MNILAGRCTEYLGRYRVAALAAVSVFALQGPAYALAIYVDQNATWRYINASAATDVGAPAANWYAVGFDDSNWFTGAAPFTSNPGNPASTFGGDLGNVNAPYGGPAPAIPGSGTLWSVPYDPYLRITFDLAAQTDLTVWLAVDNGVNAMYLNGVQATGSVNAEGQGFRWEHVFDISSDYTFAGTNTFALQLEDHGGATAFALVISGDDTAQNPVFTDNDPPTQPEDPTETPEPATLALFGLGMAAALMRRRRAF